MHVQQALFSWVIIKHVKMVRNLKTELHLWLFAFYSEIISIIPNLLHIYINPAIALYYPDSFIVKLFSGPQNFIIVARRTDLRLISLDTLDHTAIVLPIHNMLHVVVIEFDPIEGFVYWTDQDLHHIKRAKLSGSGTKNDNNLLKVSEYLDMGERNGKHTSGTCRKVFTFRRKFQRWLCVCSFVK